MLRVGILGGGRVSRGHAAVAAALAETELAGIAEIDPERLAAATGRFGCRGWSDYREMLGDDAVDAVLIALPHWLHAEATIESLEAGKHVLLEKPMAMTVAECDRMIAAAERSGKVLMVAHSQEFFPVNRAARQLLRDGGIGSVVMATDTWYKPFFGEPRPPWFLDGSKGGGMWPMNGSHMVDRLTFLVGEEVAAVKARVGSPIFGLTATDSGIAYLEMQSGLGATIAHAGYREGVNRFNAEITGTEGQIRLDGDSGGGDRFWRSHSGKWEEVLVPGPELPLKPGATLERGAVFGAQTLEFARAVREGREPEVSPRHARHVVEVLEACEESSRLGREVRLSPPA